MARTTRAAAAASATSTPARAANTGVKRDPEIKKEETTPQKPSRKRQQTATETTPMKRVKKEEQTGLLIPSPSESASPKKSTPKSKEAKAADLQSKKLKAYAQYAKQSPFPDFHHPTPEECKLAHRILARLHGQRKRPEKVVARNDRAGCGDSPSVLDALVRTILSQNTSDANSTRAKLSMDKVYGGSDKWDAIVEGGEAKLQEAIKCGGLSVVKSKVIISILRQAKEKYGKYSLDHLHEASTEDAMTEMLAFQGVGPKTASCVLLFCLQREDFAVDTHVHRITGLLGWRPKNASREETYAHLNVKIPDEDKYGLHILLVGHGKKCDECRAGGKAVRNCELRKAFRQKKLEGEAGEDMKEEEEELVKEEV
jgi:endonuclease III